MRNSRANAADAAPRWSAKPEPSFTVSALSGDHRISRFAPTLTHRVHYGAPKPFGHRQWLKLEGRI
jgi:hypothetical protein